MSGDCGDCRFLRTGCLRDECKKVGIDLVRMRGGHAMGKTGISFQRSVLQELDRPGRRDREGSNLIVLAMHHQNRHVNDLQVFVELGLRKTLMQS